MPLNFHEFHKFFSIREILFVKIEVKIMKIQTSSALAYAQPLPCPLVLL